MTNANFYELKINKISEKKLKLRKFIYAVFTFIPSLYFLMIIHELGHYFAGIIVGADTTQINFKILSAITSMNVEGLTSSELIFITIAGSLSTFIIGCILFFLFYKFHLNPFLEYFFYNFSIILIFDLIIYNMIDVFITQSADWYYVYVLNPFINFAVLIISIVIIYSVFHNFDKIRERCQDQGLYEGEDENG